MMNGAAWRCRVPLSGTTPMAEDRGSDHRGACYSQTTAMKKWLIRAGLGVLILVGALFLIGAWSEADTAVLQGYKRNDELTTIKPGWPGTPVDQKERFMNHEFPFLPSMVDLLKWKLGGNKLENEKEKDQGRLEVKDPGPFLRSDEDGIMWLGHASFYIRLGGIAILTDPVFGDTTLIKRFVPVPSPLEQIPQVDYILLSHDHRDHMDEQTLRGIAQKFPNAKFLAGLRSEDVLNEWKGPANTVGTAGWFQEFALGNERVQIYFLPVRHWSRRGIFDTNWRLWGGFVIQSDATTIYFGGDSGYGRHYGEAAELFPSIDYFLIGIGAYEPRWFMEPNHNDPADVIKAFVDSGARYLVPMHYGTFDLSDEPPSRPLRLLAEEAEKRGVRDRLRPLAVNGSLSFLAID
jgi:L-ascorbate metabolism protein UlaG (beta-lactamase superfamily)